MSDLTKAEQFNLVEDAVKTGVAPAEIAAAFNELTALHQELKKLGEPIVARRRFFPVYKSLG